VSCATHEERTLEPSEVAPSQARRLVREALGGKVSADVMDTAELLVSELVTNAVIHGSGTVVVTVDCDRGTASISVSDEGRSLPRVQPERPMALGGRGLRMIDSLAGEWGVEPGPGGHGKQVWVRLP
jgi:anti-sigma regulatory factor (Ser/Thr protein kinase)